MQTNNEVIKVYLQAACIKAAATILNGRANDSELSELAVSVDVIARNLYKLVTAKPWERGSEKK